jgi:hypothetical protein
VPCWFWTVRAGRKQKQNYPDFAAIDRPSKAFGDTEFRASAIAREMGNASGGGCDAADG